MAVSNLAEGATGPSLLGTGDIDTMQALSSIRIRWGGFIFSTLCLFGYFVQESRTFLRIRRYWKITAILLAIHLLIFAEVLTHVEQWRLPWFIVMAFEYPVMLFFRDRISIQ